MDSDSSIGTETHKERSHSNYVHVEWQKKENLTEDTYSPTDDLPFFSAKIVSNMGHDHIPYQRSKITGRLKQRCKPLFWANHNSSIIQGNGRFNRLFQVRSPYLLIIIATDKIFTSVIISHLLWCATEVGYIVKEVEGEENHSSNEPFDSKDKEKYKLIPILSSHSPENYLYFIFLLFQHRLFNIHIL